MELDGDQSGLELPHLLAASPWSGALFVAGTVLVSLFGAIRVSRAQAQEGMAGVSALQPGCSLLQRLTSLTFLHHAEASQSILWPTQSLFVHHTLCSVPF